MIISSSSASNCDLDFPSAAIRRFAPGESGSPMSGSNALHAPRSAAPLISNSFCSRALWSAIIRALSVSVSVDSRSSSMLPEASVNKPFPSETMSSCCTDRIARSE